MHEYVCPASESQFTTQLPADNEVNMHKRFIAARI
jgi:hypothetical protein